ncbi:ribosome biogenesis protein WDR12 homolog, partial [Haematococcus lacustris]
VAGVSSSSPAAAVTASYDGCLRSWDLTGEAPRCTHSWTAHPSGVNTVASAALQLPGRKQAVQLVASGGKDHAVCLWQVDHASDPSPTHHLLASCRGHTDSVECVALSPDTQNLASCGWDGALLVWRAGQAV